MDAKAIEYLLQQTPVVVTLAIGFALLWKQNVKQQDKLSSLLDQCWNRLLDLYEKHDNL